MAVERERERKSNCSIPSHFDAKPITPYNGQGVVNVSDLITDDGVWDEAVVRETFLQIYANAILRTPLKPQEDDWWAWELKFGDYTVKSAYRKLADPVPIHASASADVSWKKIWKLIVPPKVKIFWWRVVHEFLPSKDILHHRHIEPTKFCEACGADTESVLHAFTECTTARLFWTRTKELTGVKLPKLHPLTWATDLLRDDFCSEANRSVLIIGMYALWMQRNNRRHGSETLPIKRVVQWSIDLAHDLWMLFKPPKQMPVRVSKPRWSVPMDGWFKCNTDGATIQIRARVQLAVWFGITMGPSRGAS